MVNIVEKESQSTSVSLIPSSGKYAAELSGVLAAAGTTIPQDINVIITPQDTISNLVKHNGNGAISSVYVESLSRKVIAAKDGKFSATMPAISAGTGYTIVADDFIDPDTETLFECVAQDITLYSGKKSVVQIKYVQYKIHITGRTKHFINAFGEELVEDNASRAIRLASNATGGGSAFAAA